MTPSHPNAMAKFKRSRAGRVVWWIWPLIGGITLVMLSIMIFVFGIVSGVEISKQDLTFRNFTYRQIPGFRWQVGPLYHDFPFSAATDPVIANHLKPLGKGEKVEWDLVRFDEFGSPEVQGDAIILEKILNQRNDQSDFYWVKWSTDHPKRAAELWPAVQDLVFCGMYWAVPPLMELYISGSNDTTLVPERNESIIANALMALEEAKAQQDAAVLDKIITRLTPYDEFGELKKNRLNPDTSGDKALPSEPTSTETTEASTQ